MIHIYADMDLCITLTNQVSTPFILLALYLAPFFETWHEKPCFSFHCNHKKSSLTGKSNRNTKQQESVLSLS